jgi:hypothetical protein
VILALFLVLAGAAVLSEWSGLEQFVALSSWPMRVLWLPFVILLSLLIFGMLWWLWKLAGEERRVSQFPDIDWAWDEAALGLRKAGLSIDRLPVFLLLGQPANGIGSFFQAARTSFAIADIPRRPDAPVKVYATSEAIYVTCPGTSLLARLSSELTARSRPQTVVASGAGADGSETAGQATSTQPAPAAEAGSEPVPAEGTATATSLATPATTAVLAEPRATSVAASARPSVLSRAEEVEVFDERLRHLCGVIARARRPFCPANGILALVPYAGTDDDSQARQVGTACHLDLKAIRNALGISCPVFTVLTDMEQARCFSRLIRAYSADPRYRLLGRSFPLVPDMDIPERVHLMENGMDWVCQGLISPMVYRLLQIVSPNGAEDASTVRSNAELFQLLSETNERWRRLGRILGRIISLDSQGDLMLGGAYLAATGETDGDQAFVASALQTLAENQNFVSWTTDSLRADRSESRRALLCNLGFLAVLVGALLMLYWFWVKNP